jgi:hypothetical protein
MDYLSTALHAASALVTGSRVVTPEIDPLEIYVSPISVICALAEAAIHKVPCSINIAENRAYCEIKGLVTTASRTLYGGSRRQLLTLARHISLCIKALQPHRGASSTRKTSDAEPPVSSREALSLEGKIYTLFQMAQTGLENHIIPSYAKEDTLLALRNTHLKLFQIGLKRELGNEVDTIDPARAIEIKLDLGCASLNADFLNSICDAFIEAATIARCKGDYKAHLSKINAEVAIRAKAEADESFSAPSGGAGCGAGGEDSEEAGASDAAAPPQVTMPPVDPSTPPASAEPAGKKKGKK